MQQPPEVSPDPVQVELSKRLDSIERCLDRMETHQREDNAALRQKITALRQDMTRNMRWIIGVQLTTLIALGTLILSRLPG